MIEIDPCKVCLRKYPIKKENWPGSLVTNLENLNDCLYNLAGQVVDGYENVLTTKCDKCMKNAISWGGRNPDQYRISRPIVESGRKYFLEAMESINPTNKEELKETYNLCLQNCGSDKNCNVDCSEVCKDAYNSIHMTKETKENYTFPTMRNNDSYVRTDFVGPDKRGKSRKKGGFWALLLAMTLLIVLIVLFLYKNKVSK